MPSSSKMNTAQEDDLLYAFKNIYGRIWYSNYEGYFEDILHNHFVPIMDKSARTLLNVSENDDYDWWCKLKRWVPQQPKSQMVWDAALFMADFAACLNKYDRKKEAESCRELEELWRKEASYLKGIEDRPPSPPPPPPVQYDSEGNWYQGG